MDTLKSIKDDLNAANLERKIQAILNIVCDRLTADENAEKHFTRSNRHTLANYAREFQDYNFIMLSALKMLASEVGYTLNEVNESIEKASRENFGEESRNA